ncbi:MAG: S-layer homology domain-containing protein, partial [Eubacteriales bacterium]|nr:S-layer homology domain-containing protein [Eubacteriales bacterium]
MKKRVTSLLLVFCIMLSIVPTQIKEVDAYAATSDVGSENPFTDVNATDWFYQAVQYARQHNIFSGTS